jgi:uroporphyrinogen decarboxylase
MTGKERIWCVLNGGQPDQVPTFEWFIDKQVGRALTASEDIVEIVDALGIDGVNIRPDYTHTPEDDQFYTDEWGSRRQLTGDVLAAQRSHPIEDIKEHEDYTFPDPEAPHRFHSLQRALETVGDTRAVILNVRDGFSDMRDLLGYENALIGMMTDPEVYQELLERVGAYNLDLAKIAAEQYGITIVATTDDVANANGMLIRPEDYFSLLAPVFEKVVAGFHDLGLKVIKHCDGDCSAVLDFWIEAGIDCFDPVDPAAGFDMGDFKSRYGGSIALKGNIDCTGHLCSGNVDQVREEVKACLQKGGKAGGLILSSSNTIHRGVKPENYQAMLEALRQYGRYPIS